MIRKGVYLTQEAFRTLLRHKGVTAISVVIMSLSLLMLAVFLLATDNLLRVVGEAHRDLKIYVYLEDGVSQTGIEALHRQILAMDETDTVVFVSKHQALADFRQQLGEETDLLDALETNPLPNAFWVQPKTEHKNRQSIAYAAGKMLQLDGVGEVRYGKEFLDKFTAIVKGAYYVDAVVGLIVIFSAVFIISNAVRLTVIGRRRSIEILRLVGATNRFVTMPFIVEGAFQGGVAAAVSLLLLTGVTLLSRRYLPDLTFFSAEKAMIYTFTCIAIGSIGSFTALRRYLRV
jgi:cell division transport system permease protein